MAFELVEQRALEPGDFYVLLPPRDDIHRVRTTSTEASVSLHLLTNDIGCVWRHTFDAETGAARPFRSGYVNTTCDDRAQRVPRIVTARSRFPDAAGLRVRFVDSGVETCVSQLQERLPASS